MADETGTVLELRGITKRYPGIVANDHVDFDLRRGEVHALLGENGAGKSTLMNILYGLTKPDEGEILVSGKHVSFSSAKDAIETGIGMVHQHFMLIPVMTVAENIVLGVEPVRDGVLLDQRAARRRVEDIAKTFKFSVDPDARVDRITVGQLLHLLASLGIVHERAAARLVREHDVLGHGHHRDQHEVLVDHPDAGVDGVTRRP